MATKTVTRNLRQTAKAKPAPQPAVPAVQQRAMPIDEEIRRFFGVTDEAWQASRQKYQEIGRQEEERKAKHAAEAEQWRKEQTYFWSSDSEKFTAGDAHPGEGTGEPALIHNPEAPPSAIAAAALVRAENLLAVLEMWEAVDRDQVVSASKFASSLLGTAHEIKELTHQLYSTLPAEVNHA